MLVASDIHLLGNRRSAIDVAWTDWQLFKSFRMLRWWRQPTTVLLLGDLLDQGGWTPDTEWAAYVERFQWIFGGTDSDSSDGRGNNAGKAPAPADEKEEPSGGKDAAAAAAPAAAPPPPPRLGPDDPLLVHVIGNHDSEFGMYQRRAMVSRFEKAFGAGASVNRRVVLPSTNTSIVILNSMALDACDRGQYCADKSLHEETLRFLGSDLISEDPRDDENMEEAAAEESHGGAGVSDVLIVHMPLFRESDGACGTTRLAESGHVTYKPPRSPYTQDGRDVVSKMRTAEVLRKVQPKLVLSGHTHARCDAYRHDDHGRGVGGELRGARGGGGGGGGGAIEYTVPTFSWRMRPDPGFALVTWGDGAGAAAVRICGLPNELHVFGAYALLGVVEACYLAAFVVPALVRQCVKRVRRRTVALVKSA